MPQAAQGSVKETVEQILVAFILAFVFRCYIVEAFVIPTGSMAPTLLGAHMNFRCADCGYHFSVNYTVGDERDGAAMGIPDYANESYPVRCANCGYRFPLQNAADPENDADRPAVKYGDRILVQKYVYLLQEPSRWDVVVFKNPDKPVEGSEPYQDNYIKRLVGLPNERLMILDGDLYSAAPGKPREQLSPGDFTIQTKTRKAQDALWRVVYDDNHRPRGLPRSYKRPEQAVNPSNGATVQIEIPVAQEPAWTQPWKPTEGSTGWDTTGRAFRFDGRASAALEYDITSMAGKWPLTDWLAYDVNTGVPGKSKANFRGANGFLDPGYANNLTPLGTPLNNVSDVKLAVSYERLTGDGELKLSTTKQGRTFTAVIAKDEARLEMRSADGATVVIGRSAMRVGTGKPSRVELVNADYRVALRIDDDEVAATTPQQFAPDIGTLLRGYERDRRQEKPQLRIEAGNQTCELSHVGLWRDVYYLTDRGRNFWGTPSNFPAGDHLGRIVELGSDEFFVLGDNSMLSGDARGWTESVNLRYEQLAVDPGRVPRRFLLGRAFFVYWPAGFAPVSGVPAFVPNFGEMRFIH